MQNKTTLRHVIFLGAGASKTSGYPLASELRLRLADDKQIQADLKMRYTDYPGAFQTIRKSFDDVKESVDLFRHGAFGSVDEFAKLASLKYSKHVQAMKRLTRLALSLHNPEEDFHKSDYYPFIQNLFDEGELQSLKSYITVISYNYDCYLEYLLLKSHLRRNQLAGSGDLNVRLQSRLSSGFAKPNDAAGLSSLDDIANQHFRHFKLHGSITYATEPLHRQLFEDGLEERLKPFGTEQFENLTPPIVFPWELFDEKGNWVNPQQFPLKIEAKTDEQHAEATTLYNLFTVIWRGAREAVQKADRISFVGLSMHRYVEPGMKFLFDGKKQQVEIVVANEANDDRGLMDRESLTTFYPGSPRSRVSALLKKVAPEMELTQSSSERRPSMPTLDTKKAGFKGAITARNSFREFIEKEL
jgi:hypothetical protein